MSVRKHTTHPEDPEHNSKRSGHWKSVQREFISQHPVCEACGCKPVNVHHQIPFHYVTAVGRPDLELEVSNLITLCVDHVEQHHLLLGHLDNFKSYNPNVTSDVEKYGKMTRKQILNDREFRVKMKKRPPPVDQMTKQQKDNLRKYLDKRFPPGIHESTRSRKKARRDLHLSGYPKHTL